MYLFFELSLVRSTRVVTIDYLYVHRFIRHPQIFFPIFQPMKLDHNLFWGYDTAPRSSTCWYEDDEGTHTHRHTHTCILHSALSFIFISSIQGHPSLFLHSLLLRFFFFFFSSFFSSQFYSFMDINRASKESKSCLVFYFVLLFSSFFRQAR